MSALETIGLFWVILSTGIFTAGMLIAAVWSITLGVKVIVGRYHLGESMERTIKEAQQQQRLER